MKKLISLLLAAAMLCGVLAACDSTEIDEEKSPAATTTEAAAPEETEPEETEPEETEPEEAEPEENADNAVVFGVLEGNVYTNEYAGFRLELDDNWTLMTSEELQELPENVEQLMQGTALGETMKKYTQLFDMQAQSLTDMRSINVVYQVKAAALALAGNLLTEEQLIDATLTQKDLMTSTYESMGMEDITIEKTKVQFMGQERFALKTSAKMLGLEYYIVQLIDYSCGEYGVYITCAAFGEADLDGLLALFQPLN